MTASKKLKVLLAGVATFALIGTAFAQGTPPDASKSAPVGAGQRSTQGTPMGTTGTPVGGGATASQPTTSGNTTAAAPAPSTSGGSTAGSTMTADNSMAKAPRKGMQRKARADRN